MCIANGSARIGPKVHWTATALQSRNGAQGNWEKLLRASEKCLWAQSRVLRCPGRKEREDALQGIYFCDHSNFLWPLCAHWQARVVWASENNSSTSCDVNDPSGGSAPLNTLLISWPWYRNRRAWRKHGHYHILEQLLKIQVPKNI